MLNSKSMNNALNHAYVFRIAFKYDLFIRWLKSQTMANMKNGGINQPATAFLASMVSGKPIKIPLIVLIIKISQLNASSISSKFPHHYWVSFCY